jgi:succinate-semialdehyde dehydrogenase / glutarate-semialdehyde dehydrogenase
MDSSSPVVTTGSGPVHALYVDGCWVESSEQTSVVNPATGLPLAQVFSVDRSVAAQAFEAAQRAFLFWRDKPARDRAGVLMRLADALDRESDTFASLITAENGKPLSQSKGEVAMSSDHLRWFAEEAKRAYGRVIPNQVAGKRHMTIKFPVGAVGIICPWNFPLVLVVRKAAAAWAAGCSVVLKPAPQTPLSALGFARLTHEAALPAGLFNVIAGPAAPIGAEMLENPLCRKISFTGSTAVGRQLIAGAAHGIKPLSLELGGHAPLLVFDDADLEKAVEGTLVAKFRNAGQSCIAANRIFVQRAVYPAFVGQLEQRVRALKVGEGIEPGVDVGPLIDAAALAKAERHIADAVGKGASVVVGGKRLDRAGNFLEPTVLTDVAPSALCMNEETFGPVAPICVFDGEQEVIEKANASAYGLAAYAFTRDLGRTFRLAERLEAGTVSINDPIPTTSQAPFGGVKQSGWGRELGSEGLDAFLETKHICLGID